MMILQHTIPGDKEIRRRCPDCRRIMKKEEMRQGLEEYDVRMSFSPKENEQDGLGPVIYTDKTGVKEHIAIEKDAFAEMIDFLIDVTHKHS